MIWSLNFFCKRSVRYLAFIMSSVRSFLSSYFSIRSCCIFALFSAIIYALLSYFYIISSFASSWDLFSSLNRLLVNTADCSFVALYSLYILMISLYSLRKIFWFFCSSSSKFFTLSSSIYFFKRKVSWHLTDTDLFLSFNFSDRICSYSTLIFSFSSSRSLVELSLTSISDISSYFCR